MSIHSEWLRRKKLRELDQEDGYAIKRFEKQKNAINQIRDSEGLEEILTYFKNLERTNSLRVLHCATPDRDMAIAEAKISKKFLQFIENLFNAEQLEKFNRTDKDMSNFE